MRFQLSLITLSLMAATGAATPTSVLAADFGVHKANISTVKTRDYQCKRCTVTTGYQGELSVGVAYTDADDIHAANALNSEDGTSGVLNGDIRYQDDAGYQAKLYAKDMGLANSSARIEAGQSGSFEVAADYRQLTHYQAGHAQSQLWYSDGTLTPDVATQIQELSLQRKKVGVEALLQTRLGSQDYAAFARYHSERKQGHQSRSLVMPAPVNFGLPVDSQTDTLQSGIQVKGQDWLSELSYQLSQYDNDINRLSLPYLDDVYQSAPDNQAHQVAFKGQYRLEQTVVSAHLSQGRMIQDEQLVQMAGNPVQNWDGQIDTLDGQLRLTSLLSNKLRVGASVNYSERDNQSSVWDFAQLTTDGISGAFRQNVPLDTEKRDYKVNMAYRINSDYRVQAGLERKEVERSHGDREQTQDTRLWGKATINCCYNAKLKLKASVADRGGSTYQAVSATSTLTNPLLRKYDLADRKRHAFEAQFIHNPAPWLNVNLKARYAKDDYDQSELGLIDATDYGYDLNLGMTFSKQMSGYVFAGQQWIDSRQLGSQSFSSADWSTDIEDEFIHLGAGVNYAGLMQDKLSLGADYLFANSGSDTFVSYDITTEQGDYYSYSHSVDVYANYQFSQQMAMKLAYQYERYYDTDYAQVDVNAISGLTTLGDLNHNYNAHQVMLSFSYQLR
ncbi:MtrB/PioB family decaheme-associated outer membrane protein [Shewanella gelidii]|nr:MtrB/PioB family decaheme-associated outer membrane protein [Shewanella gelidii]MCL1098843.1 MtrB/PioB family decaheme-associated outer membrane protein [Shewanella gelidii]